MSGRPHESGDWLTVKHRAEEALALWRKHRAEIDLLYADMVMLGGLSGIDLAKRVLADKPRVKVIITSGYNSH